MKYLKYVGFGCIGIGILASAGGNTSLGIIIIIIGLIIVFLKMNNNQAKSISHGSMHIKPQLNIETSDGFTTINSLGIFGPSIESSNGRYKLVWMDADASSSTGGYRTSGKGKYALVEGESILTQGSLERPNDGKVADNGIFILADWRFGEGLKSSFHAFYPDGRPIGEWNFSANMLNTGISISGKFAIAQLANSSSDDGGCLVLFDLVAGKLLWKKLPESGWANTYEFDETNQRLRLCYGGGRKYSYTLSGDFLDQEVLEMDQILKGTLYERALGIESRIAKLVPDDDVENSWLNEQIVRSVVEAKKARDDKMAARFYRLLGELYERTSEQSKAIDAYRNAILADPKVGVKRRLGALEKRLTNA